MREIVYSRMPPVDKNTEAFIHSFAVLFTGRATRRCGDHRRACDKMKYLGQFRQSINSMEIFSSQ